MLGKYRKSGPALVVVGLSMMSCMSKIDFDDLSEAIPAAITILMMVCTYNIANGLTAGLVIYPLIKLAVGRLRDINSASLLLAVLCLSYYVFGLPH